MIAVVGSACENQGPVTESRAPVERAMFRRISLPIILKCAAGAVGIGVFGIAIARLEERRPIVELEQAGATVVVDFDGLVRSVSFCEPAATDRHLKFVAQLHTVTSVTLTRASVASEGVALLANLPQLRTLDLSETPDAAGSLVVASRFPALRTLQLRRCPWVDDAEFAAVQAESGLENLLLVDAPVSDAALAQLRRFPRLLQLGLDDCKGITDAGLQQVTCLEELKELSLDRCTQISPDGLSHLAGLPNLQMLGVRGVPIHRDDVRRLAARFPATSLYVDRILIPELQPLVDAGARIGLDEEYEVVWVELDDRATSSGIVSPYTLEDSPLSSEEPWPGERDERMLQVGDEALQDLALTPDLKALFLRDINVTDEGLTQLAQLSSLEWLVLDNVRISDRGLAALADLPRLRRLWLQHLPITGSGLAALESAAGLYELSLYTDQLTPEGVEQVGRLSQLRTLVIGSRLPAGSAAHLAALPELQDLAVVRTALSAEVAEELSHAPALRRLQIVDSRLAPAAFKPLGRMKTLSSLHLGHSEFDAGELRELMRLRPEINVSGIPDQMRDMAMIYSDERQLLGGIPSLQPRAPASVH